MPDSAPSPVHDPRKFAVGYGTGVFHVLGVAAAFLIEATRRNVAHVFEVEMRAAADPNAASGLRSRADFADEWWYDLAYDIVRVLSLDGDLPFLAMYAPLLVAAYVRLNVSGPGRPQAVASVIAAAWCLVNAIVALPLLAYAEGSEKLLILGLSVVAVVVVTRSRPKPAEGEESSPSDASASERDTRIAGVVTVVLAVVLYLFHASYDGDAVPFTFVAAGQPCTYVSDATIGALVADAGQARPTANAPHHAICMWNTNGRRLLRERTLSVTVQVMNPRAAVKTFSDESSEAIGKAGTTGPLGRYEFPSSLPNLGHEAFLQTVLDVDDGYRDRTARVLFRMDNALVEIEYGGLDRDPRNPADLDLAEPLGTEDARRSGLRIAAEVAAGLAGCVACRTVARLG